MKSWNDTKKGLGNKHGLWKSVANLLEMAFLRPCWLELLIYELKIHEEARNDPPRQLRLLKREYAFELADVSASNWTLPAVGASLWRHAPPVYGKV